MTAPFDPLQARKELLQLKAQMERMELGMHADELTRTLTWLPAVRQAGAFLSQSGVNRLGPLSMLLGPFAKKALSAYPVVSALASTLLVKAVRSLPTPKVLSSAPVKAGAAALALAAAVYWFSGRSSRTSRQDRN